MNEGFKNFLKVFLVALSGPIKLLTLALGLTISLLFPPVAIFIIPLALGSTFVMAWGDSTNSKFIEKVLSPSKNSGFGNLTRVLEVQARIIQQELKKPNLFPEVTLDLKEAKEILQKISSSLQNLPPQERSGISFIQDFLPKLTAKLTKLTNQEQTARYFLQEQSKKSTQAQIEDLKTQQAKLSDKIAIKEYEKAINLKNDQLSLIYKIESKLGRIDSYIASIKAALEQSNAYITKVSLRDDNQGFTDEGQYLTESLKQITTDIDDLQDLEIQSK